MSVTLLPIQHVNKYKTILSAEKICKEWNMLMHPEGNAYFIKTEKLDLGCKTINIRFLTEDFLNDRHTFWRISEALRKLRSSIKGLDEGLRTQLPVDIDAYVGTEDQAGHAVVYYLVGCKDRRVFWAEEVDLNGQNFYCGIPIQSELHLGN